jgi:prepilin-type N-terminal cleavage/methylation domain-containing protein
MFKFLKSKKGFTLVELMIVVVIMAILVAVAVPIFSAVTKNARTKTCIGNQREIISSVGNWLMLQSDTTIAGSFTTVGGQDGPDWGTFDSGLTAYQTDIEGLFKTVPVCPDAAATITATIVAGSNGGKSTVTTACAGGENSAEHVVPGIN